MSNMRFADVLEIINGKNQKQVECEDGKYPIYGSGGIIGWANDYICPAETIIIGRKGSINNPIYAKSPFWNVDTAFGLVANKSKLIPKYLYYFCCNFNFLALNTTVTIPSLTKANLLKININVPSLEEQAKVIEQLDCIERLIEIKKTEKKEMERIVKARFVELFGECKERKRLEEYATLITKGASPKWQGVDYCEKGTLFVTSENVREGYLDLSKRKYLDDKINEIQPRSMLKRNDILINIVGASIGRAAIYDCDEIANINQAVALVRVDCSKINQTYLMTFLNTPQAIEMYGKMKKGGARDNLSLQNIADLKIPVTSIEIQNHFATFVEQTDKAKAIVREQLNELKILKKSLMQKYFG